MTPTELFNKAFKYSFNTHLTEVKVKDDCIKFYYTVSDQSFILALYAHRLINCRKDIEGKFHMASINIHTLRILLNNYPTLIES